MDKITNMDKTTNKISINKPKNKKIAIDTLPYKENGDPYC